MQQREQMALIDETDVCDSLENHPSVNLFSFLLAKLLEKGFEPTVGTYNILVIGMCKEGRVYEAEKIVNHMKDRGCAPSESIYTSLLESSCKDLNVELALEVFELMIVEGFEPSLCVFKVLICALDGVNKTKEAQRIFEDVLRQPWSPDDVVWTLLIDGLLHAGKSDLCMNFLHMLETTGNIPDLQTYAILARDFSKVLKPVEIEVLAKKYGVKHLCG